MGKKRRTRLLVKAVDTNIVARALMRDDPVQTPIADSVLTTDVFVPITVVLEAAWLFRSRYGLSRADLATTLRALLDMPSVTVDAADGVRWALSRAEITGDIADLIHLVASRNASAFLTFDDDVAKAAGNDPLVPVQTLA